MNIKRTKSPIPIEEFDISYPDEKGGPIYSLPPELYWSKDFYEFELNAVWRSDWICIGRANEIPNAGDYYTVTIGNDPLIVIRDRSGSVNVLSNVCQHKGMLILEGRGNTRRLQCPLHAWVYSTKGDLVSAPGLTDVEEDFDIKEVCLPKIRSDIWEGFVFVTFDETIPSLQDRLGHLGEQIKNYDLAGMRGPEPLQMETFDWNWKIFNDECYHCGYLPISSWGEMYPLPPSAVDEDALYNDESRGIVSYHLLSTHPDAAPTHTGSILQPGLPGLTEEERSRLSYITVAPNMFIVAMPDKVKYFIWLPAGPTQTFYGVSWLYPESTLERDDFRKNYDQEHTDLWPVMEEDLFAWRRTQAGMESSFATRGRLTSKERVIHRLQKWLIDKYRAEDAAVKAQDIPVQKKAS